MRNIIEVLNKLNDSKAIELKSEKVEMGLISDADKSLTNLKKQRKQLDDNMDSFLNTYYDAKSKGGKINGSAYTKAVSDSEKIAKDIEKAAKELGVKPSDVGNYNELKSLINTSDDITDNLKDITKQVSKMTI